MNNVVVRIFTLSTCMHACHTSGVLPCIIRFLWVAIHTSRQIHDKILVPAILVGGVTVCREMMAKVYELSDDDVESLLF